MDEDLDDDALLAEANAYPETEQQQAMVLALEESEPRFASAQSQGASRSQQQQAKPQPSRHSAPLPVQEDDFDIGDDELEEYLQEQQQNKQGAAAVMDDDYFPDELPAPKATAPPQPLPDRNSKHHNQQQQQQKPSAASAAHTGLPKRTGGGALTNTLDPEAKRPRTAAALPDGDSNQHAGGSSAAEGPEDLDNLIEDPGPADAAATVRPAGEHALAAAASRGPKDTPAKRAPIAPAYQPPRFLASEVEGDCIPVTASSGFRVYCKVHTPKKQPSAQPLAGNKSSSGAGTANATSANLDFSLLAKPIRQMMQDLEDVRMNQLLAESRALAETRNEEEAGDSPAGTPPKHKGTTQQAPGGSLLWVNKYAPQSFMSLLSDEQTNRAVAQWVKSWDPSVFGTTTGPSFNGQQHQNQSTRGRGGKGQSNSRQQAGQGGSKASDGRPEYKAILLAGPPGLGKTTLAHVVARHCGYHPYEINASDDRTATSLTQRVTDAVQMKPVLGSRKPNCVVIDEIDGATGGSEGHSAIAALVKIITAGSKQQNGKAPEEEEEEGDEEGKPYKQCRSKRGKGLPPLARPLICIANDLYAPALRPLREVAKIFQFKEPNVEKLVSRLHHMCNMENVRVDKSALYSLVQRAGVDIRSCLNTLQLLAKQAAQQQRPSRGPAKSRPPPYIKAKQVEQLNIGIKDTTKGVFAIWDELLHLPGRGGSGALHLGPDGGAPGGGGRIQKLYSALQDFGEHELVMAGLHENLHNTHFLDVHMRKTSELLDSFAQADLLMSVARRTVSLHLLSYVPATALLIHLSAAQQEKPHLAWPKPLSDSGRRAHANLELMRGWATRKVSPRVLQAYDVRTLITEVGPALVRVLAPSLRAMAPNLLTPAEHAAIRHTSEVMVAFGLSYCLDESQQQAGKPQQGARPFSLAAALPGAPNPLPRPVPLLPEIDRVVHNYPIAPHTPFPTAQPKSGRWVPAEQNEGIWAEPVRPVPLVLRQMLNQQVLLAKIRQAEVGSNQAPGMGTPGSVGKENTPGGSSGAPHRTPRRMQQVSSMEEDQPEEQQQQQQEQQPERVPGEGAAVEKAEGKPPAPVNWLTSLRTNMSNKWKRQQQQQQQRAKSGGGADVSDLPGPPGSGDKAGKPQFSKLYRFNEGYTNAVKRPLLIKDLL